jgi:hypothetical protein
MSGGSEMPWDRIVIARSHRASSDARHSPGYGDAAIQKVGEALTLPWIASLRSR